MRIGIAISGCGMSSVAACCALKELEKIGICPQYISCSLGGVAGLLAASCGDENACLAAALEYLRQCNNVVKEQAIKTLCGKELITPYGAQPIICCVNNKTAEWKAYGFNCRPLDEICCAAAGLTPYKSPNGTICDFSSYFGCPLFPLKAAGADRVIAFVYAPEHEIGPWEACRQKLVEMTAVNADCVLTFANPKCRKAEDFLHESRIIAKETVHKSIDILCQKS